MPNVVVLVVDGLSAPYLGPYGNTWLETPAFNRLAAEGLLWETVLIPSPELLCTYDSFWNGWQPHTSPRLSGSLITRLHARNISTRLLANDSRLCSHSLFEQIDHFDDVSNLASHNQAAVDLESTETARFFANALDAVHQLGDANLLWLHCQGMEGPWDAPFELREQFADEDDPEPIRDVIPPRGVLPADGDIDPDELHRRVCAYAGQVTLLDSCFEIFLQAIRERDDTLLIVTSSGGYPLGEHRRIGRADGSLHRELLHVPLIARWPTGYLAGERRLRIGSPALVYEIVDDWSSAVGTGGPSLCPSLLASESLASPAKAWQDLRDAAVATGVLLSGHDNELAIRTRAWFARFPDVTAACQSDGQWPMELYLKPDDAWEVNDVAVRCPSVVQAMQDIVRSIVEKRQTLEQIAIPPQLHEELA